MFPYSFFYNLIKGRQAFDYYFTSAFFWNGCCPSAQSESKDNKPKILIADDDPVSCMILQQLLKSRGYAVITAYDGDMAFAALQEHNDVFVAILDMQMPKMGGIETLGILPILILPADIDIFPPFHLRLISFDG